MEFKKMVQLKNILSFAALLAYVGAIPRINTEPQGIPLPIVPAPGQLGGRCGGFQGIDCEGDWLRCKVDFKTCQKNRMGNGDPSKVGTKCKSKADCGGSLKCLPPPDYLGKCVRRRNENVVPVGTSEKHIFVPL
jgi:hypothetical protein